MSFLNFLKKNDQKLDLHIEDLPLPEQVARLKIELQNSKDTERDMNKGMLFRPRI